MKQRVLVQVIMQSDDKVLLLRRSQGKPSAVGRYELPGGVLDSNEQPDDSVKRHIKNDVGIAITSIKLKDVMVLHGQEDPGVQHVFIAYAVNVADISQPFRLGQNYDQGVWKTQQEIQHMQLRESAITLLGLFWQGSEQAAVTPVKRTNVDKNATSLDHVIMYSDGGSRGNPGPSAAAYVILDSHHNVIDSGGDYLGITTNNQAEYHGVRLGLESALKRGIRRIECRVDSMLVVNQLKGIYKIKNRELWPINERIRTLIEQIESVRFIHVPREQNQLADGLVNEFLDEHKNDQR